MLPVQDRRRGAFTVPLFLSVLALIHSCSARSQLIGPSQPIVAFTGDDVILPCHLEPAMDASDVTVEWARPDLEPRFVLVRRDGVELEGKKHPSFRRRSSLFTDQLKHGNVSLKLSAVETSDQGTYRCFLPDFSSAPMIRLIVGAVSSAVVQKSRSSGGVLLQCESAGWYPEPELLWLDAEGRVLPAGRTETLRRPDGLYNVSSRATVERRHGSSFTCRVQQQSINQSRETPVHVPDHFFMVPSTPGPPGPPGPPGVIIGSVVGGAALLLLLAGFIVWKCRQRKSRNKRRSPEDGPEHTEGEQSEDSGLQVLMEGREERHPLMAAREEENDADTGAERAGGEKEVVKSLTRDQLPLTGTEGETKDKQDMTERQALNNADKEQTMKLAKPDSGALLVPRVGRQTQQLQNVHTDQEVRKQQDTAEDEDEIEARDRKMREMRNKKTEQQQERKGSGSTGKKKQEKQRERKKPDLIKRRQINQEMPKTKKGGRDEMELKPQREDETQHLHEGRKEEKMTEGKTKEDKQDMTGRPALNNADKEQTMKLTKPDSGALLVPHVGGQTQQLQNVHTDQEVQGEEETHPGTSEDMTKGSNKKTKGEINLQMEEGPSLYHVSQQKKEENNADSGAEEEIRPQRKHEDKTHPDHLGTEAEGERKAGTISHQHETHQQQDTTGRQMSHEEPGTGDSGFRVNLLTDQEVRKRQDTAEDEREAKDGKKINKKTEQQQVRKGSATRKKEQEKQRERRKMEIDKQRNINQEMPKTKEGGRDEMELRTQREDETQHLLEGRKAEHEDEDKQERNQSFHHISSTTERKAEEETEKRDRELQSDKQEKMEIKRQKGDQQVSGGSKPETEHEDEKGGEADITAGTQRKEEKVVNDRKLQREERVKRVQERKVETAQRKDPKQTESSRNQEGEQSNIMRMTEVYLNDVEMEDEDDKTEPEVTDEPEDMDVDPPQ